MDVLHDRCAGLDIGKRDLKACVRTPSATGRSRRQEIRTFATTTNALLELRDWLVEQRVTLVVLEATGDYWRGAFYLLEDALNVILVMNPSIPRFRRTRFMVSWPSVSTEKTRVSPDVPRNFARAHSS